MDLDEGVNTRATESQTVVKEDSADETSSMNSAEGEFTEEFSNPGGGVRGNHDEARPQDADSPEMGGMPSKIHQENGVNGWREMK